MTKERQTDIKSMKNYILDMDGTLYKLDKDLLFGTVIANSIKLVQRIEKCSDIQAAEIIANAKKDKIGISNVLAQKYGITRSQVFEVTWDINPREIVKNFDESAMVVNTLFKRNKNLILVTAAPKIWMEKVLDCLKIEGVFSQKFTAEDFGEKIEIFKKISTFLDPSKTISIGDQVETDIIPAAQLGMNTFLVTKSSDLLNLI